MANGISTYLANEMLDHVLNNADYSAPTIYVALFDADPDDSGSEISGGGYARVACSSWEKVADRVYANSADVSFNTLTASVGTIAYVALYDASSDGHRLWSVELSESRTGSSGRAPTLADGDIEMTFSSGGISTTLANEIMEHWLGIDTYAITRATYAALYNTSPGDNDSGTEVSGSGYARKQINANGGASPTWDLAASMIVDNTHDVAFDAATGDWTEANHVAIRTASTAGTLLFYGAASNARTLGNTDTYTINAGDLDCSLTRTS